MLPSKAAHPKEIEARWTKALKLAAHLHAHGILACELPRVTFREWALLAEAVQVNAPTFVDGTSETVAIVDRILRTFEAAVTLRNRQAGEQAVDIKEIA